MSGAGLRRFVGATTKETPAAEPEFERCEMCGEAIGQEHGHVVDLHQRSLMCTCRGCSLLFTRPEAGGGRFRAVPRRYLRDARRRLSADEWERLGIPVRTAFFLRSEHGTNAFYPSPAGATECLLDLGLWAELGTAHPLLTMAEPDVEAILAHAGEHGGGGAEYYLVPIDECYHLVGLIRLYWTGFDGGPDAAQHIDEFFARIAASTAEFAESAER